MRSSDEHGERPTSPEPDGDHARRRLDEEMTSRFGAPQDAEQSVGSDGEPPDADRAKARDAADTDETDDTDE